MNNTDGKRPTRLLVIFYPFAVLVNAFAFDVRPLAVALPPNELLTAYGAAAALLIANHSWLMTSTELTRIRYGMYATPEEWAASGRRPGDVAAVGHAELARCHNAHRNTTENTVYFLLPALLVLWVTPDLLMAQCWVVGFAVARLGYTWSYLAGRDNLRGLFMTLSLIALYGLAGYLVMALLA